MGATLVFADESGFSLVCPLKSTWAPRGQTPTIRTSIQHHERLNLIGAVRVSPAKGKIKLHIQSYWDSLTGDEVIAFLQHLLQHIAGAIVLVWDKHPIHRRRKVKDFLACHPRIHAYDFPTGAPELNPTEGVWTQVSESTASTDLTTARNCKRTCSPASLAHADHPVVYGRVSSPLTCLGNATSCDINY